MAYLKADYGEDGLGNLRLVPQPRHRGWGSFIVGATLWTTFFAVLSTPLRRWFAFMVALTFVIVCTIGHAPTLSDIDPSLTGAAFESAWANVEKQHAEFFGLGYQFPWYCKLLIAVWLFWLVFGFVRAHRRTIWLRETTGRDGSVLTDGRNWWASHQVAQQQAAAAERQATGDAVVDAMRRTYEANQTARQSPATARHERRNVIDVPALPPAPESPTGPSQAPSGPPPPPGSGTPTLWVPTYSGPAKPVQRRETTLGGINVSDRRRVDPEGL